MSAQGQTIPSYVGPRTNWFTCTSLKNIYTYDKVQNAATQFVDTVIIPDAMRYVENYVILQWLDPASVPTDILNVTRNYAVNKILADDENVRIAQARGQASFTVAGNQVNLDLNLGRNPLLSIEDEQTLMEWRIKSTQVPHTDKIVVKSEGNQYLNAPGPRVPGDNEYVRGDWELPIYFYIPSRNF